MSAAAWSFYHPLLLRSALERLSLILSLIRSYFVAAAHVLLGRPLTGGYICVSRTAHVPSARAAFAQTAPDLSLQQTNDRGVTATSNDVHRKRLYGKSSFTHTHVYNVHIQLLKRRLYYLGQVHTCTTLGLGHEVQVYAVQDRSKHK